MYQSQINRMYVKHDFLDRVYQGDILRDLNIISWDYIGGECQIKNIKLPYAVVMTQDCDLDRDYENRKEIKELESEKNKNVEPEDKSGKKKEKEEKEKHDKYVPSSWQEGFEHHGNFVLFILDGAKDVRDQTPGNALFPEILKAELREVRSTIEAYSKRAEIYGYEEASACGVRLQKGSTWNAKVRAVSDSGAATYLIDRWD